MSTIASQLIPKGYRPSGSLDSAASRPAANARNCGFASRQAPALTAEELRALADFICATRAVNYPTGWRASFSECLRRGTFGSLVPFSQGLILRKAAERFDPLFVCFLRTSEVMAWRPSTDSKLRENSS